MENKIYSVEEYRKLKEEINELKREFSVPEYKYGEIVNLYTASQDYFKKRCGMNELEIKNLKEQLKKKMNLTNREKELILDALAMLYESECEVDDESINARELWDLYQKMGKEFLNV